MSKYIENFIEQYKSTKNIREITKMGKSNGKKKD